MVENKLTDKTLRSLKPSDSERQIGDGGGLWVRVLPQSKGGSVSFYYRFLFDGKEHRFNCGTYPEVSLAEARQRRNQARNDVKTGINPLHKLQVQRTEAAAAIAVKLAEKSVDELFDDWKSVYLSAHHKDGGKFVKDAYDYDVRPMIGTMKARDVRLPHVIQVIDRILDRGARRKANQILAMLRQMFRHGVGRGLVDTDPTLGMTKKQAGGHEKPVERYLSFDEIRELDRKLGPSGMPARMQAGVRLLLATGVRVGELLKARWDEIDLKSGTWKVPAENAKNGLTYVVHLSEYAKRQLSAIAQNRVGVYLFSGRVDGAPLSDKALTKAVRDRIRAIPLQKRSPHAGRLLLAGGEWSPHDLRRTMATLMGDLGVAPHVIERCINHKQQGIVGVYQRQEYMAERKQAFEMWGDALERCTTGESHE
jgi:integrase